MDDIGDIVAQVFQGLNGDGATAHPGGLKLSGSQSKTTGLVNGTPPTYGVIAEALQGKVLQLSLGASVAAELPPEMGPAMGIYGASGNQHGNVGNEIRGEKMASAQKKTTQAGIGVKVLQ